MLFYALKLFVLALDLRCKIVLLKFLSLRGLRVLHNSKAIVQNSFIVHKSVVLTAPLTQIHERSILDNGEDVLSFFSSATGIAPNRFSFVVHLYVANL